MDKKFESPEEFYLAYIYIILVFTKDNCEDNFYKIFSF